MARFALRLAYDGSKFAGWQRQKSGITAQLVLEEALERIYGKRVVAHGASRTDAGVHALGQCAHFDTPTGSRSFSPKEIFNALNAHLPDSLRVFLVRKVGQSFHAQFSALSKTYCYRVFNGRVLPPLAVGRCWHIIKPLDIDAMRKGAEFFVGKKDFGVFGVNSKTVRENTVREIKFFEIRTMAGFVWLRVTGDGFLYRMVRGMVGALVSIGRGKAAPDWAGEILITQKRDPLQITAPPGGLCLMAVHYQGWTCGEKKITWS